MRLTPATMYARLLESDATYNGRFFTGVLTTGIYCLPSCKARKPKAENVRFFPTAEGARAAGLRPCKKCHPDDFARGADPVLEAIEAVVAEVRATPSSFPDAKAVVRRSGFGPTRLFELFRQHWHATPAEVLLRARLEAAKLRLRQSRDGLLAIAHGVGFESVSVFHDHFRRRTGLTPAAWRSLESSRTFTVALPENYPLGYLRRAFSRDPHSVNERLDGDRYTAAVRLGDAPAVVRLHLQPDAVAVDTGGADAYAVHAVVAGWLGLEQDAAGFARAARSLGFARLVAGRENLRIVQTSSVFDGLLWAVIGQQINLPFACLLRRRLTELAGMPVGDGLFAPPTPAAVAALEPAALLPLQFSRQKADYVVGLSRRIVAGELDLEGLRTLSATRAERTLLALRGLGPWSVNYLMMRALGFADCVPLGDTGVTSGLQALMKLETRPDVAATRRLMAVFSPYRSLATAHLWQLHQPIPA